MSWSTLFIIVVGAFILYIALKLVAGVLRLGIALALFALICFGGYWAYMNFIVGTPVSFDDVIPFIK